MWGLLATLLPFRTFDRLQFRWIRDTRSYLALRGTKIFSPLTVRRFVGDPTGAGSLLCVAVPALTTYIDFGGDAVKGILVAKLCRSLASTPCLRNCCMAPARSAVRAADAALAPAHRRKFVSRNAASPSSGRARGWEELRSV